MSLPAKLILQITRDVINTPAIFIFDLEFDIALPRKLHPPLLTQRSDIRFLPAVNSEQRTGGVLESVVSKTIRALLLTNKSIRAECLKYLQGIRSVPRAGSHAIVRFNPREHVICIRDVDYMYIDRWFPGRPVEQRPDQLDVPGQARFGPVDQPRL
jgi:hypothetical protein